MKLTITAIYRNLTAEMVKELIKGLNEAIPDHLLSKISTGGEASFTGSDPTNPVYEVVHYKVEKDEL